MVGIVIVCHSYKMTKYFIEFLEMFKTEDFKLLNGANDSMEFGTTPEYLASVIEQADSGDGVLVFVDFGSSIDNTIKAKKLLENKVKVKIADCPVIEGCIAAVAGNSEDLSLEELKEVAEDSSNFRKVKVNE